MHARLIARSEDRGGCSVIGAPALGGPRRQKRLVEVGRRWCRLEVYGLGREGAIDREDARDKRLSVPERPNGSPLPFRGIISPEELIEHAFRPVQKCLRDLVMLRVEVRCPCQVLFCKEIDGRSRVPEKDGRVGRDDEL